MPIETSLADMQWLTQAGDAGTNLARGAQVGSAIANSRYQQQRINLEKQQLAAELAMQPLKRTLLQQSSELNKFKLEDLLEQNQLKIQHESAIREAYKQASQAMSTGQAQTAPVRVMEVMSKTLGAADNPRFQQLLKTANDNAALDVQLKTLQSQRASTAAIQNSAQLDALKQAYNAAVASGNPAAIAAAKDRLDSFSAIALPKEEIIYDPTTGRPIISRGPAGTGGLTVATQTRLQEDEMLGSEAVLRLNDAIAGVEANPNAIGVRGKVGAAVEKARGQLSPTEKFPTPITDTQQKASMAFSAIAPLLKVDKGNMSKYELSKLEQAGEVLSYEEAPQTALNKLNNLRAVVVGRQLRLLKAQNKPAPDSLLRAVQGTEIAGLLQSGLLTVEEANRLYNLK